MEILPFLLLGLLLVCVIAAIRIGSKVGGDLGKDFYAIRKNAAEKAREELKARHGK